MTTAFFCRRKFTCGTHDVATCQSNFGCRFRRVALCTHYQTHYTIPSFSRLYLFFFFFFCRILFYFFFCLPENVSARLSGVVDTMGVRIFVFYSVDSIPRYMGISEVRVTISNLPPFSFSFSQYSSPDDYSMTHILQHRSLQHYHSVCLFTVNL